MSNSNHSILRQLLASPTYKDEPWVMVTLIKKVGSAYRDVGALMFVGPSGERLGVMSGGCLEKAIVREAFKVSMTGLAKTVEYNSLSDDEDAFSTGCQGKVYVHLRLLSQQDFEALHTACCGLNTGQACKLVQPLAAGKPLEVVIGGDALPISGEHCTETGLSVRALPVNDGVVSCELKPVPRLLLAGGGEDVIPMVRFARILGWDIAVWDDRTSTALDNLLVDDQVARYCSNIQSQPLPELVNMDAVVIMTHHWRKDAAWLEAVFQVKPDITYIAMLGPKKRQQQVRANISEQALQWSEQKLVTPAGLDIGGDLPESVALSVITQCHAYLHRLGYHDATVST